MTDVRTDHTDVLLMDRPVVPLTPDMARATSPFHVVTSIKSRITLPLRAALASRKGRWVVRDGDGYYDGLTGRPLRWHAETFAPVPNASDYAPGYKTRTTAALTAHLTLVARARHSANAPLGGTVAHAMRLLTGRPPTGWGASEPLEHSWDPSALTAHVRSPSFDGSPLIVVGHQAQATVELTLAPAAVNELTTLTVAATKPELPSLISALAAETPVFSVLAHACSGRTDLTIEPRWTGSPAPLGLAVKGNPTPPPDVPSTRSGPITWFPLGDGHTSDWTPYNTLLKHLH